MEKKDLKIIYLSTFFPRQCGIANFTQSLITSIKNLKYGDGIFQKVIAMDDKREEPGMKYASQVVFEIEKEEIEDYKKSALYINESGADLLNLQHEYNLFGGFDGIFILKLLEKVKVPIISSFHTIPVLKDAKRRDFRLGILKNIAKFSKYVIVTAELGRKTLIKDCKIPAKKIITIYHGTPDVLYTLDEEKQKLKEKFDLKGRFVLTTYGLLSKGKGIEYGIEAMAKLIKKYPQVVYLIVGKPHPAKKNDYSSFKLKVEKLKLEDNVLFIEEYLKEGKIVEYLKLTDIYLMPNLTSTQISSGTLAYAMAAGNCAVSTPFLYAKELIGKDRGYFVNFEDAESITKVISELIENPEKIEKARKNAYDFSRKFTWPEAAKKYLEVFSKAVRNK